ncbi:electron transfer flavoprotein subunit alpha/FixB family protein [Enterovibrio norvegicus]|uniref:Electron transfer flavoprotein alpha subunit n=1 Tax=Enterovibrio norvegicus DSM 15893 TaxID=1121869 RepID=A0A1I5KQU9_9GAMM|nr:electron transfer flavoprotein subunit alpha/FixB family protein [Enterovibrio norvegicus]SFO87510.1 electron transfer flavoprotein alpha subunit [Enterovibrio norvegicus DSM 15893]
MSDDTKPSVPLRRNRRLECIARNRLHPEHAALMASQNIMLGGTNRKDPHHVGFFTPEGIKRIDRSGETSAGAGIAAKSVEQSLPRKHIASPSGYVVVVSDGDSEKLSTLDKDMLGLAQQLAARHGDDTAVLLVTVFARHDDFSAAGADRVLALNAPATYSPEQWLSALLSLESSLMPVHWIFPDSGLVGGDLGRKLSVEFNERPATRVRGLVDTQAENVQIECGSGDAGRTVTRQLARVLLVEEQVADPISGYVTDASSMESSLIDTLLKIAFDTDQACAIEDAGSVAVDPKNIPLPETGFILSGGNGVRNWALFHQCADALGATEGASRVAVDNGHMPRTTQVGASGTYVNAKVYIAVGISGAIQHLQGMTQCDTVIAINADPACDMVKRADLSIIADSSEVMQALVDAVQGSTTSKELSDAS